MKLSGQIYTFRHTHPEKVFSSKFESRALKFIKQFQKFIQQYISSGSTRDSIDNSSLFSLSENNSKLFNNSITDASYKTSHNKQFSLENILLESDNDNEPPDEEQIQAYISSLCLLLYYLNDQSRSNYSTIINYYREIKNSKLKEVLGYNSPRFFPCENKYITGEIITARLQILLAKILGTSIELNNPAQFRKNLSIFIYKLAYKGYKNFSCLNFRNLDFSGMIFTSCNFAGTEFISSNLSSAKFSDCDFSGTNMRDANLEDCTIDNSILINIKFDSLQQASELIITPEPQKGIVQSWFLKVRNNSCVITKQEVFSLRDLNLDEGKKLFQQAKLLTTTLNFDCPLTLEKQTDYTQACAVLYPNSNVIRFYNAQALWSYLKRSPNLCPYRQLLKQLQILKPNDLRILLSYE